MHPLNGSPILCVNSLEKQMFSLVTIASLVSQARERLLSKVKADQERLKQLDARTAETTQVVETMKQRIEDLESDLQADRKGDVAQNKVAGGCILKKGVLFSGV